MSTIITGHDAIAHAARTGAPLHKHADPAAWRLGEPARSEVFEVFRVDPERFPALAARIALAAEEDEAALRADHAEGDAERGQCEARP